MVVSLFCSMVNGTSLMKRIRDRQNADDTGIAVARDSVQEALLSIDDRLARLDSSMDQLVRRLESKLGRLETKFDLRMSRVVEAVVGWELTSDQLSRRLDALGEKVAQRTAHLEARMDMRAAKALGRLDSLERDLHSSVDEILDRLVKGEEKSVVLEGEIAKVHEKTTAMGSSLGKELVRNFQRMGSELRATTNRSERVLVDVLVSGESMLALLRDSGDKIDNLSASCHLGSSPSGGREGRSGTEGSVTREQMDNLTAVLGEALTTHEAKFRELDSDVEMYTKKVISGIQELWRTSDGLKADLSDTLQQGSRTRELVREEFRRLHEKIEPLPKLEPRLTDISEDLDRKVFELGATVDSSFAALLVAQNTFIASCKRVQEEETHVYDILQLMVYEMRNRSASDTGAITAELRTLGSGVGRLAEALSNQRCVGMDAAAGRDRNASETAREPVLYDAEESDTSERTHSDPVIQDYDMEYQLSESY